MEETDEILKIELEELAKKFPPEWWSKTYFMYAWKAFSINIPKIENEQIILINEFCEKYNLYWVIMQAVGKAERGISIVFNNKK